MSSMLALITGAMIGLAGPVTEIRVDPSMGATEILVTFEGDVQFRDFTMEGPNRLVVDLMGANEGLPQDVYPIRRGGIRSISSSMYGEDVVRLVLELDRIPEYEIVPGFGMLLITIPNDDGPFDSWSSNAPTSSTSVSDRSSLDRSVTPPMSREPAPSVRGAAQEELYSWEFNNTPVTQVLFAFAEVSGRSIVPGTGVAGLVSAKIDDQPWEDALEAILAVNGWVARELESGIIRVDNLQDIQSREAFEAPFTETYRINYATASEVATALAGALSTNGRATAATNSNAVIVSDIARVHEDVQRMIRELDVETPVISISAKLIFVSRTDLEGLGVVYDLKDSAGNQLNQLTPGAGDLNGDGTITLPEEQLADGENAIALGGNSVAALGNANARIPSPTLTLLNSLVIGRHTLLSFVEALESRNLSDIQASPSVTTLDNQEAILQVGQRTPLRVIDAGGAGAAGGQLPQATVQFEETGVILQATPHVTANDNVLLEVRAERSAPQLAESDVGFIFNTQNATSRVLVRDGETVVIAGLTVTTTEEVRSGIPLLMNLPVIGGLFRTTRTENTQQDLIILVTPNIVR